MIPRYSRTEMTNVWSDNHKFQTWLQVEVAATQGCAKEGLSLISSISFL